MKTQESHLSRQPKTKKGKESQKDTMHGYNIILGPNWLAVPIWNLKISYPTKKKKERG